MEAKHIGNARTYRFTLGILKTWFNERDIAFSDITPVFLAKFETAHLKKGKTYGGLAEYFRTIRSNFNKAIKAKIVDRDMYPFESHLRN